MPPTKEEIRAYGHQQLDTDDQGNKQKQFVGHSCKRYTINKARFKRALFVLLFDQ